MINIFIGKNSSGKTSALVSTLKDKINNATYSEEIPKYATNMKKYRIGKSVDKDKLEILSTTTIGLYLDELLIALSGTDGTDNYKNFISDDAQMTVECLAEEGEYLFLDDIELMFDGNQLNEFLSAVVKMRNCFKEIYIASMSTEIYPFAVGLRDYLKVFLCEQNKSPRELNLYSEEDKEIARNALSVRSINRA